MEDPVEHVSILGVESQTIRVVTVHTLAVAHAASEDRMHAVDSPSHIRVAHEDARLHKAGDGHVVGASAAFTGTLPIVAPEILRAILKVAHGRLAATAASTLEICQE